MSCTNLIWGAGDRIKPRTKVLIEQKVPKHSNAPAATHSPHEDATQNHQVGTEAICLIWAESKA